MGRLGRLAALALNIVSGGINIAATVLASALSDRVGRCPLLFWGAVGLALTLGILAAALSRAGTEGGGQVSLTQPFGLIALVAANADVLAFGVSWGSAVWTMLSQMFPNRLRGPALAVAVMAQWLANWVVTLSFPPMLHGLGPALACSVHAAFAALSLVFVLRSVRETRGRALEDIWPPQQFSASACSTRPLSASTKTRFIRRG